MSQSTYSYLDSVVIVAHPLAPGGILTIVGEGAGDISVTMQETRTTHDVSADGSVMVSKIAGNQGSISFDVQQTSEAHKVLVALFNNLILADPVSWAAMSITVRNITNGSSHLCTGCSPTKIPDKKYSKQGGHVSWTFLCADIQNLTF